MELQFRAVPWMTNRCAGGATSPRIVGELQQSARDAINAGLTFPLRWRTRMIPLPSHRAGSVCDRVSLIQRALRNKWAFHDRQVHAISSTQAPWPRRVDRGTNADSRGCFLTIAHLEIFTCTAIQIILGISIRGARLQWAARAEDEPTATEGGDPSGTYKRWFGRVSGRAGWRRDSPLVGTSYWPGCHRRMRAGSSPRARPGPTDGRSDAVATRTTLSP